MCAHKPACYNEKRLKEKPYPNTQQTESGINAQPNDRIIEASNGSFDGSGSQNPNEANGSTHEQNNTGEMNEARIKEEIILAEDDYRAINKILDDDLTDDTPHGTVTYIDEDLTMIESNSQGFPDPIEEETPDLFLKRENHIFSVITYLKKINVKL